MKTESIDTSKPDISFIGLGTMGFPMAGHLAQNGYPVTVYNRNKQKAQKWLEQYPGEIADSITQAVSTADIVLSCVGNDTDVREIYATIMQQAKPTAIFIDHTTTSAQLARELAQQAKKQGFAFIDAPVSGGEIGAQQGTLTIMAGGEAKIFKKVRPILNCYAKSATLIGSAGFGQRCKMINQLCVAGILQGLSEGLTLAKASGIDALRNP